MIDNIAVIFLWRSLAVNLSCDLFQPPLIQQYVHVGVVGVAYYKLAGSSDHTMRVWFYNNRGLST